MALGINTFAATLMLLASFAIPGLAGQYPLYTYPAGSLPGPGGINAVHQDRQGLIWIAGERGVVQYDGRNFRCYSVADGLCDNYVNRFVEAPDGSLWICTWRGISRYDPRTGIVAPLPDWTGTGVRDVVFAGDMIIAATEGGIFIRKGEGLYPFIWALLLPGDRSSNLCVDLERDTVTGIIWAATELNGVLAFRPDDLYRLFELRDPKLQRDYETLPNDTFRVRHPDVRFGPSHFLYQSIDSSLMVDPAGRSASFIKQHRYDVAGRTSGEWFLNGIEQDLGGVVWAFSRVGGLFRWNGKTFEAAPEQNRLAGNPVYFFIDDEGCQFIGGSGRLVAIANDDTLTLDRESGLSGGEVAAAMHDQQGTFWVLTRTGVVQKLVTRAFQIFTSERYPLLAGAGAVLALDGGRALVGGEGGLAVLNGDRVQPWPVQPPVGEGGVLGMTLDQNGELIFATKLGLYRSHNERRDLLLGKLDPAYQIPVFARDLEDRLWINAGWFFGSWDGVELTPDTAVAARAYFANFLYGGPDGSLLIGNWFYFYRYRPPLLTRYDRTWIERIDFTDSTRAVVGLRHRESPPYMTDLVVTCGEHWRDSTYFLGTFSGTLVKIVGDSAETLPTPSPPGRFNKSKNVRDRLYFLASEGLFVVDGDTVRPVELHLSRRLSFNDLIAAPDGRWLLATSGGLLVAESLDPVGSRASAAPPTLFDRNFGLPGDEVVALHDLGGERFLIVQREGVTVLDMRALRLARGHPRPLVLTAVEAAGTRIDLVWNRPAANSGAGTPRSISLKRGQRDIRIRWALGDYTDERQNTFTWHLEGATPGYGKLTGETEAVFHHLPPGELKFYLRGRGALTPWSAYDPPLMIVIPAYFYETWWFWITLIGSGFAAGTLVLQRRLAQLRWIKVRLEAQVAETERELHEVEETVEVLSGMIPICANCKKVRDDRGFWLGVEQYIARRSEAQFSHAICPECTKALYPDYYKEVYGRQKVEG
ncbi:MAG: hypothetical protein FJY67_01760 [Calditrichaeota bacterium]|nr:hypothetical protein [Calditrichota bacterium]